MSRHHCSPIEVEVHGGRGGIRRRGGGGGRGSRGGRLFTARGRIPASKRLECRCSPGNCTKAIFRRGSFDNVTRRQARDFADDDDVLAIVGEYSQAIGSGRRKSVRFWENQHGDLEFAIDVPSNDRGKALMETFDVTDVYARPVIDVDASDVKVTGELADYTTARVRALTIGPTDAAAGWTPLRLRESDDDDMPDDAPAPPATTRRRARIWL